MDCDLSSLDWVIAKTALRPFAAVILLMRCLVAVDIHLLSGANILSGYWAVFENGRFRGPNFNSKAWIPSDHMNITGTSVRGNSITQEPLSIASHPCSIESEHLPEPLRQNPAHPMTALRLGQNGRQIIRQKVLNPGVVKVVVVEEKTGVRNRF